MTKNIIPIKIISDKKSFSPAITALTSFPITKGKREIIPTMIMSDIPFPIPLSVTFSPIHIRSIVPVTILTIAVKTNKNPGLITT